jgi:hypothetical protein
MVDICAHRGSEAARVGLFARFGNIRLRVKAHAVACLPNLAMRPALAASLPLTMMSDSALPPSPRPGILGAVPLLPPYALDTPRFRFRALAALAGRSPLGGEREVALAALLAARLAVGALPSQPLPQGVRVTRAAGARAWFASLALPPVLRQPLARLVDATTSVDGDGLDGALRAVIDAGTPQLDAAAIAELREVVRALEGQPA